MGYRWVLSLIDRGRIYVEDLPDVTIQVLESVAVHKPEILPALTHIAISFDIPEAISHPSQHQDRPGAARR